jgi:hypothetical protein
MLSKVMDNAVTVPLINKRIGLDAVLGLIPYAGVRQMQAAVCALRQCPESLTQLQQVVDQQQQQQ